MTDLEAIALRTSRRAYSGRLNIHQLRELERHAATASLQGGLDIRVVEDGAADFGGITKSYGLFSGVRCLVLLAGRQSTPHLQELCGYYGERMVLEATKLGLGSCWVGGTFDRRRIATTLPGGHTLVAVLTVGPVKESKGLMEKTVGRVAAGRRRLPTEMYTADAPPPGWFMAGMAAVARAPSALNRQPVRVKLEKGAVTARVEDEGGLALVDLGIAKLHFELAARGRFAVGNGGAFTRDAAEKDG